MMRATRQSGFTMIELMVAMVITLVVSAAIFGLLSAGNNAFRREPQLADRQQNIRMAMDMITRDITAAGSAMATDVQVFTINDLPANTPLNNPPAGSWPSVLVPGQNADYLEIMSTDPNCPALTTCNTVPGSDLWTNEPAPACFGNASNGSTIAYIWGTGGSALAGGALGILDLFPRSTSGNCGQAHFNWPGGQAPGMNQPGACPNPSPSNRCQHVALMHVSRYEIAADPDNPNSPALYHSPEGRATNGGLGPCTNGPPGPCGAVNPPWQLVATGVEDLQIRYLTTGGGWQDAPAAVVGTDPTTWVREVQVVLSAQSIAQNLAGQTTSATGNAVRGQLVQTVTPRAVLMNLDQAGQWH